jgi:hypothetical protein
VLGREPVPENACSRTILDCNGEVQALAIEGLLPRRGKDRGGTNVRQQNEFGEIMCSIHMLLGQGGRANSNSNSFQRLVPGDSLGGLDGNHRRLHLEFILSVSPTCGTRTEPRSFVQE